jgi:adenosylcobinamide-phosphate synthase
VSPTELPYGFGAMVLVLAWAVDARWGEPPNAWHPVAWMGRVFHALGRALPMSPPEVAGVGGALAWAAAVGSVTALAWAVERAVGRWPWPLAVPALALALKPTFAWRMLRDEVAAVEQAQSLGLDAARERVARLCSRDVSALDADDVRETALETLAENLNDSLVTPLLAYAVAGLAGAWAWRAVNTLDAMWGYRGRWEWAGKCAARADDLLAWPGARLSAWLILGLGHAQAARLRHEAARTSSPNGGWPMAALALRLGVRLGKPGVYRLNEAAASPQAGDTARAIDRCSGAARVALLLAAGCTLALEAMR